MIVYNGELSLVIVSVIIFFHFLFCSFIILLNFADKSNLIEL